MDYTRIFLHLQSKYVKMHRMKWQIQHFDRVISTNETAKNFPVQTLIIANQQTGGKGRLNRVWESPVGNLYMSAVTTDFKEKTPLLSYLVGIAVAHALSDFNIRLKWPNDIFLNGGKLGGILLERLDHRVIIGIGVNTFQSPAGQMMYPVTSLMGQISPIELANKIADNLSSYIEIFEKQGFNPIRKEWLSLALGLKQEITVHLPTQEIRGIFKDLSPQGELVLETPDKTVLKITAGDVFI